MMLNVKKKKKKSIFQKKAAWELSEFCPTFPLHPEPEGPATSQSQNHHTVFLEPPPQTTEHKI